MAVTRRPSAAKVSQVSLTFRALGEFAGRFRYLAQFFGPNSIKQRFYGSMLQLSLLLVHARLIPEMQSFVVFV